MRRLGDMRSNPSRMVKAHFRSYRHATTGRLTMPVLAELWLPPLGVLALGIFFRINLASNIGAGLIGAAGLVGAFLFSAMLSISQRAMEWADDEPRPSPPTTSRARLLEEMAANAGYAALICVAAVVAFTIASVDPETGSSEWQEWVGVVSSTIGLALGTHLIGTLLMVMKRVFAVTQSSLWQIRGGNTTGRDHAEHSAAGDDKEGL